MKQSKIGVLFFTTILALAGVSASYAGFTDTIEITGTATTGSVDMDLESVHGTWAWKDIPDHEKIVNKGLASDEDLNGDTEAGDDTTAFGDGWYTDTDDNYLLYSYMTAFNDTEDEDHIIMKWDNLTPEINYELKMKLHYTGKTPARIQKDGIIFAFGEGNRIDIEGETDILWLEWLQQEGYLTYEFVFADEQGNPTDITVDECTQLHYCDRIFLIINVEIPQIQVLQGLEGELGFTINLIQFDEAEDCDGTITEAAIGNLVWRDLNKDGIQDEGEPGVEGVTVNLYSSDDSFVDTMQTDANGEYLFNVLPGDYYVEFILPDEFEFTLKDQGSDDMVDSDADQSTGKTIVTTLVDGEVDTTWDAGIIQDDTQTDESCVSIQKTFGPYMGDAAYELLITVSNTGSSEVDLTDVSVTDTLGSDVEYISYITSKGTVTWINQGFTWTVGTLPIGTSETLSIHVNVECDAGTVLSNVIEPVESPPLHPVTRTTGGGSETVYYTVVKDTDNTVKYEDCENNLGEEDSLGEDGVIETDTFVMIVENGSLSIDVETKAGQPEYENTLVGTGDTIIDDNGYEITFVEFTDLNAYKREYVFTVSSTENADHALSHITFDFGSSPGKCELLINEGATVQATSECGVLEATTEDIMIIVNSDEHLLSPDLPTSTEWASDCCQN